MAKKIRDEQGNLYVQKKPIYKRTWFLVVAVLLILATIKNAFGGGNSSASNEQTSVQESTVETSETSQSKTQTAIQTEPSQEEEVLTYGIGQEVPVGDMVYTVHSKEIAGNVGGEFGKNANGVFLILNISVKNNGKKAVNVSNDFFTLLKGEVEYESDSSAGIYANSDVNFFLSEINPESTLTGNVVFDLTEEVANAPSLQLRVQTGFWGTETGLISLQ